MGARTMRQEQNDSRGKVPRLFYSSLLDKSDVLVCGKWTDRFFLSSLPDRMDTTARRLHEGCGRAKMAGTKCVISDLFVDKKFKKWY
jgi:hypothetical protein